MEVMPMLSAISPTPHRRYSAHIDGVPGGAIPSRTESEIENLMGYSLRPNKYYNNSRPDMRVHSFYSKVAGDGGVKGCTTFLFYYHIVTVNGLY